MRELRTHPHLAPIRLPWLPTAGGRTSVRSLWYLLGEQPLPPMHEEAAMTLRTRDLPIDALRQEVWDGLDARAPLEAWDALDELVRRLRHAERKWHGHHVPPMYGPTCPLCKAEGR